MRDMSVRKTAGLINVGLVNVSEICMLATATGLVFLIRPRVRCPWDENTYLAEIGGETVTWGWFSIGRSIREGVTDIRSDQ